MIVNKAFITTFVPTDKSRTPFNLRTCIIPYTLWKSIIFYVYLQSKSVELLTFFSPIIALFSCSNCHTRDCRYPCCPLIFIIFISLFSKLSYHKRNTHTRTHTQNPIFTIMLIVVRKTKPNNKRLCEISHESVDQSVFFNDS